MTGLFPFSLRCAQTLLKSSLPLILIPGAVLFLCTMLQGRIGFEGLLPLMMFSLWLPLPLFMLLLRRQLPFLGPGDPSLAWTLSLPVPRGLHRLFTLASLFGVALILQLIVSVEVGMGIRQIHPKQELRATEILSPRPNNPPLLSKKHPIQSFSAPRGSGKGILSFQARRFLFSASGDRVRITAENPGNPPTALATIRVDEDPRRMRISMELPPKKKFLHFQLLASPHGPISFEHAPVLWLGRPLSNLETGGLLFLDTLPWVLLLVFGGFTATSFLQTRIFGLMVFGLALTPLLVPSFPRIDLAPLQAGGIPIPQFGLSFLWAFVLVPLGLFPPRRNGGGIE